MSTCAGYDGKGLIDHTPGERSGRIGPCRPVMAVAKPGALVVAITVLMLCGLACESSHAPQSGALQQNAATRSEGHDFTNSIGVRMIWVQPGTFIMGFQRLAGEPAAPELLARERLHEVSIARGFWIASTEVTAAQYQAVMGKTPSERPPAKMGQPAASLPVTNVTWRDAVHFCEVLSRADGNRYRLPTTEEWEFACRGGASPRQQARKTKEEAAQEAWFFENSDDQLQSVAMLRPNSLGIYDMHGNAFEWCMTKVSKALLMGTPYQGRECAFIRGGSHENRGGRCDCGATTYACEPIDYKSPTVGFRVVLPLQAGGS